MVATDSQIIIVGAGVFGLSTALWLARAGYKHVTVYDRCAFDRNFYNPANGCDGASSDINKIFRMAYGKQTHYQTLAIEARDTWLAWDRDVQETSHADLPPGVFPGDRLFYVCGCYFLGNGRQMTGYNAQSLEEMSKSAPEVRKSQFIKNDPDDELRLRKLDPRWLDKCRFIEKINHGNTHGFLDVNAGITVADKACAYAKHLCTQAGVKFILGEPDGKVESLIFENNGKQRRVIGVRTGDGERHFGDLVIMAGAWTSSIVPEASQTIEATAGTVMFVDIPKHRQDLRERFHPDNYPVWSYHEEGKESYAGGGYPISKDGRLKFSFRGQKFTNFQDHPTEPNLRISTPRTKYSAEPIDTVPSYGLSRMKDLIRQTFPELVEFGFTDSRLCWYPDSVDEEFVVDYVPGYSDSLFICSGGCGHGFKFLPNLGRHVKNQIERVHDEFTPFWKWRVAVEGKENNGLGEGENGSRNMTNLKLAEPQEFCLVQLPVTEETSEHAIKPRHLRSQL